MKNIVVSFLFVLSVVMSFAAEGEGNDARKKYIEKWKNTAMKQMKLHGIPASITLAQGILESRNGQSELTQKSNNHFGIKCHDWKGKKVYADDDKRNECFRKYKNAAQSFEDHSQFLLRKRYAALFELKQSNYKGWAKGLKKAGYATDPAYSRLLIKIIEDNKLYEFDKKVLKGNYELEEELIVEERPKKPTNSNIEKPVTHIPSNGLIDITPNYRVGKHDNNIKYIVAHGGEYVDDLAETMDLAAWQIVKYNDLGSRKRLKEGEKIFIQPKRNANKKGSHKVQEGESLLSISNLYGVKLKKLEKYNGLSRQAKLVEGSVIQLKKKK